MKIFLVVVVGIVKESKSGEQRVAISPEVARELIQIGFSLFFESGAGAAARFSDKAYAEVGAKILQKADVLSGCDLLVKVNAPENDELQSLKEGSVTISFLYFSEADPRKEIYASRKLSAFSMERIPRISRAQKMDALSSQSNLAGYKTVLLAANAFGRIFPMMMTAAGTVKPAKVLIMGAGVAGLQAIATAKRLGAVVEVSDIRPETKEQVQSLGAKFIEVPPDESMVTEGGYVKQISEAFLQRQQALVAKHAAEADIIITTALIPGKKAPLLITEEMVKSMRQGSVIVDMATEQGGNCALSEKDKVVEKLGVTIIGHANLPSLLATDASTLYARNVLAFLKHLADAKGFKWEREEEITKGSLAAFQGQWID